MVVITKMLSTKSSASVTTAKLFSIENSSGSIKASAKSNTMAGHGTTGTTVPSLDSKGRSVVENKKG